jgi:hypothetical protein
MAALCDPRSAHRAEELRVGNANKRSTTHFFMHHERRGRVSPPPLVRPPPPPLTDAVTRKALHTMPSLITQRSPRTAARVASEGMQTLLRDTES